MKYLSTRTNRTRWTALIALMVGLFALSSAAIAQEPAGYVPNGEYDPEADAREAAYYAALEAQLAATSIFDFSIAYLVKQEAVLSDSVVSEVFLTTTIGAQPFHSWDEFVAQNDQLPFQIILIHDSFYDQVDTAFTQNAYRNQVIIIGIGMPFEHLVEIAGDKCQSNPNPHLAKDADERILYFTYSLILEDAAYRDSVNEAVIDECKNNFDTGETTASLMRGTSNFWISDLIRPPTYLESRLLFAVVDHYGIEGNNVEVLK